MDEQKKQLVDAVYYATVFAIASLGSYCRVCLADEFDSWRRRMAFSLVSGILSFGIVAVGRDSLGDNWLGGVGWLGVAAILGLSSKESEEARKSIIESIVGRMSSSIQKRQSKNDNNNAS